MAAHSLDLDSVVLLGSSYTAPTTGTRNTCSISRIFRILPLDDSVRGIATYQRITYL